MVIGSFNTCSRAQTPIPKEAIYDKADFGTRIPYQKAHSDLTAQFNRYMKGDSVYLVINDTSVTAYKTDNQRFLKKVIAPALEPYLDELSGLSPSEIINELALFTFNMYQAYFGNSFYRWGGDLFDLDDPQFRGNTSHKRYGLDCSGFVMAPFDLAVYFDLLEDSAAIFSSQGFRYFCEKTGFQDSGGFGGSPNNFRIDTREMIFLGDEVFHIEKGESLSLENLKKLQPGDVVCRKGHAGMIVFIKEHPYYIESGGRIVPSAGGYPVKAEVALPLFAKNRPVSIRRGLLQ